MRTRPNQRKIRPGLVSITFRKLGVPEIVERAAAAGLEGIEWGGDIHVPAGDTKAAETALALTRDRGLSVAAYGSYYRCTADEDFEPVLASAVALEAPIIRIWAGRKGSADATPVDRANVVTHLRRATTLAAEQGITVAAEWHGGTLTDSVESGLCLAAEVDHDGFALCWQPSRHVDVDTRIAELTSVLSRLAHLHVFQWKDVPDQAAPERRPLAEGEADWEQYFSLASQAKPPTFKGDRFAMLEFVPGDDPETLPREAEALRQLLDDAATK